MEQEIISASTHLKHLKFDLDKGLYTATLYDLSGYAIVKGFGITIIEAINDMHRGLI